MEDQETQSRFDVNPPASSSASAIISIFAGIILLTALIAGMVANWKAFIGTSASLVQVLLWLVGILFSIALIGFAIQRGYIGWLEAQHAKEDLKYKQEERQRAQEKHEMQMYLAESRLHADPLGNRPFIYDRSTQTVLEVASGNYQQPVPTHYHVEYKPATTVSEVQPGQALLAANALHIPTFAEELNSGEIGPGQKDMIFCYEIIVDDVTGQAAISPMRGEIETQHTQFIVAGSQSGKTTFMARNIGQAVAMNTLFYIIDPHKGHPEKSLSSKIAVLQDWFILPPASTHQEVAKVLAHATKLKDDLIQGRPTPFMGYHIMFIVDEVPMLMAYQRSQNKQIRQLYLDLALFMQAIGTQTAKFGFTGLYSSQFATKDELGEVEIRDACMSQMIMRLHPTQAQAMRILGKETVREIPKLEKGHGYLMLSDSSEAHRVASGNVTANDLERLAAMLPPSPLVKMDRKQFENRSVIPMQTGKNGPSENGFKMDRNQIRNQFEPALQAKVDKVLEMLGQNKGDVIYAVWGERPGPGKGYQSALEEYDQVMAIIRTMAQREE